MTQGRSALRAVIFGLAGVAVLASLVVAFAVLVRVPAGVLWAAIAILVGAMLLIAILSGIGRARGYWSPSAPMVGKPATEGRRTVKLSTPVVVLVVAAFVAIIVVRELAYR